MKDQVLHLINQYKWILCLGLLQTLDDFSWHCSNICPPVSPEIVFRETLKSTAHISIHHTADKYILLGNKSSGKQVFISSTSIKSILHHYIKHQDPSSLFLVKN